MLQQMFVRVHGRYESSPHAEDLAAFASWLVQSGYPLRTAQRLVFRVKQSLNRYSASPIAKFTQSDLNKAFRPPPQQARYNHALSAYGRFLKAVGRFVVDEPASHHSALRRDYRRFLVIRRGLTPETVKLHDWTVRTFLKRELPGDQPLSNLTAGTIEHHIEQRSLELTKAPLRTTVANLRAFLHYCYNKNLIPTRLDIIDRPVSFRDALPPRALDWQLVQKFLKSIDRGDRTGWRDFMMMHLMAYYGLRPGEVASLKLDSIDWEEKTILVQQSKICTWLVLPLADRTIDLLERYLCAGRRKSRRGELFLCALSPDRPVSNSVVAQVFKARARESGLPIAHASTYSLRHSFAMRLLQRGVGIKVIGDLMGHKSIVSTAIYLRLHIDMLRDVALPVPQDVGTAGGAI